MSTVGSYLQRNEFLLEVAPSAHAGLLKCRRASPSTSRDKND